MNPCHIKYEIKSGGRLVVTQHRKIERENLQVPDTNTVTSSDCCLVWAEWTQHVLTCIGMT